VRPGSATAGARRQTRAFAATPLRRARAAAVCAAASAAAAAASSSAPTATADAVRAQLRSLIARLSASPDAADDPALRAELVALLPRLRAANPTPAPARSPKIDGTWVLLLTVPDAAERERKRGALQALLAASYDFFYERVPIVAGSAVGRRGASSGVVVVAAAPPPPPRVPAAAGEAGPGPPPPPPPVVARPSSGAAPRLRARGNFQTFDVPRGLVRNRARFEALGRRGEVNVDGSARVLSDDRLEATFLTADLRWGGVLRVPFPIGIFRPTGWVDTLFLDEDVRVSTGDKGSVFVARRQRGGGGGGSGDESDS